MIWEMKCAGISSGMATIRMECQVKLATIKDHLKLLGFYLGPLNPKHSCYLAHIEMQLLCNKEIVMQKEAAVIVQLQPIALSKLPVMP